MGTSFLEGVSLAMRRDAMLRFLVAALACVALVAAVALGAEAYVVKTYTTTTATKTGTTTYRPSGYYVKSSTGTITYYVPANQGTTSTTPPTPSTGTNPPPTTPQTQTALTAEENQLVYLVNEARAQYGLRPLAVDTRLVELARKKSSDMIANNYFGHVSPTYGTAFDMLQAAGIAYRYAAENIAGAQSVKDAHAMFMASAGHKANILGSQFSHIGVGVVNGGPYGKMITELFIGN